MTRQASEPVKIEITPEMIEAGARALRDTFECGQTISEMGAADVFEAMILRGGLAII